jgi:hypothetical protein
MGIQLQIFINNSRSNINIKAYLKITPTTIPNIKTVPPNTLSPIFQQQQSPTIALDHPPLFPTLATAKITKSTTIIQTIANVHLAMANQVTPAKSAHYSPEDTSQMEYAIHVQTTLYTKMAHVYVRVE